MQPTTPPIMETHHAAYSTEKKMGELALCLVLLRYITGQLKHLETQLQTDGPLPGTPHPRSETLALWTLPPGTFDVPAYLCVN